LEHAAGDRALFVGKGFLGLGTAEQDSSGLVFRVQTFRDDPASGVVIFFSRLVSDSTLSPWTGHEERGRFGDAGTAAFIALDPVWQPYAFGQNSYDPFESLAASLGRAAAAVIGDRAARVHDRWSASTATALWAAMEGDLYRFAFDTSFTSSLETFRDTAEWKRFARLNDLYRSCIKAIAPYGIVPSDWSAWLRLSKSNDKALTPIGQLIVRLLARPVDVVARAVADNAVPDSLFTIPALDPVES
jgi:hypothetical protein